MIGWAWVLFLFNEFFIFIVLLNFLIAIISQSYEEVMSEEEINRYRSRCELNVEVSILLDKFYSLKYGSDNFMKDRLCFYLMADPQLNDDENEFQGFVRTIKNSIKRQNQLLKEDIKKSLPSSESMQDFAQKFLAIKNLDSSMRDQLHEYSLTMRQTVQNMQDTILSKT